MIALSADAAEEPAKGTSPWVLLVISNQRKRRTACRAWEKAGYAVEVAKSALDALECLRVISPTLVVVDDWPYRPARR